MIALNIALLFSGVLIFLLGRAVGKWQTEANTRQRIKQTGFFMLEDGFYRAVKVGIDTSTPRQTVELSAFPDTTETLTGSEHIFRQPETPENIDLKEVSAKLTERMNNTPTTPTPRTIRRRVVKKA